jgi:hypothetical protein
MVRPEKDPHKVSIGAFPSLQGRPGVAVGRFLCYFQVPAARQGSPGAQKRRSLRTKIVLWRDETHNKADPLRTGSIRPRSMNDRIVMEGHFTGSQDKIRCLGFIDFDLDLFTSPQKIISVTSFLMGQRSL